MIQSVQKLSLQDTKRRVNKNVRNVLACPLETFWPSLPVEHIPSLTSSLKSCLKLAKIEKPELPWRELKSLSKEERRKREQESYDKLPENKQKELEQALRHRSSLLLGMNSVLRGIENGVTACCLIGEDTNSQVLVKHVITSARSANIPIIVFPNLKEVTEQSLGFSCLAVGFKTSVLDNENTFYETCLAIKEIAMSLSDGEEIKDTGINNEKTWFPQEGSSTQNVQESGSQNRNWHLKRDSNNQRVFGAATVNIKKKEADFISLDFTNDKVSPFEIEKKRIKLCINQINVDEHESNYDERRMIVIDRLPNISRIKSKKGPKHSGFQPVKILRFKSNPNKFRKSKL